MQDVLTKLFWGSEEIFQKADELCRALPGYSDAKQDYDSVAETVQSLVGYDLYDQLYTKFMRLTGYELKAYYSLGLGLREELLHSLGA